MKNRFKNTRFHLRRATGCRHRAMGCVLLLIILLMAACAVLFWAVYSARAYETPSSSSTSPLSLVLLLDSSDSMFERPQTGSDFSQTNLDAARLFINYLSVDHPRIAHQCSVILFGSHAETLFPLTPLTDADRRNDLLARLQDPPPMGWTDHVQALQQAQHILAQSPPAARRVIIMFTDGQPEWRANPTADEWRTYGDALRTQGEALSNAGISLFILLLPPPSDSPAPHDLWRPIWQEITAATPAGALFQARQPQDVLQLSHHLLLTLNGGYAAAPIWGGTTRPIGEPSQISVPPHLSRLTLVVHKEQPGLTVTILRPGGPPLTAAQPGVRHAGLSGITHEEIWVIDDPPSGNWTITSQGNGQAVIWPDYRLPMTPLTPTPILTPPAGDPTERATSSPTASPIPAATPTPIITATTFPQITMLPPPIPHLLRPPAPVSPVRANVPHISLWWGLPVLALSIVAMLWKYHQWRRRPLVEGELHLIDGPGFAGGESRYELDALARRAITVGASPADLVLVGASTRFTLYPGMPLENGRSMFIRGQEITLDGQPLTHECPLHDNALITLGQTRLRYQNLRLRSPSSRKLLPTATIYD